MKHHYLYQTTKLEILINEKERPKKAIDGAAVETDESFENRLNLWLSSCERYPLAPGEEEKFEIFLGKDAIFPTESEWKEGVKKSR